LISKSFFNRNQKVLQHESTKSKIAKHDDDDSLNCTTIAQYTKKYGYKSFYEKKFFLKNTLKYRNGLVVRKNYVFQENFLDDNKERYKAVKNLALHLVE